MTAGFIDRADAGRRIADLLLDLRDSDAVVLGMTRGGVAVGYAVAQALNLALLPLVVRKVGAPGNPELALGAVSESGVQWIDPRVVEGTRAPPEYVRSAIASQIEEARRQHRLYRGEEMSTRVRGRTVIIVDDGVATGASAVVAVRSARSLGASSVVIAVPVAASHAVRMLRLEADRVVVLDEPDPFLAVGLHYGHFDQVSDDEVVDLIRRRDDEVRSRP